MSVHLLRKVRLLVGAGSAKPGPGIGQALGPLGLNMADFCKQFNEVTKNHEKDVPIPVDLSAFSNRSFTFVTKSPQTSYLIKKCAGIKVIVSLPFLFPFFLLFVSDFLYCHLYVCRLVRLDQDMMLLGGYT